MKNWIPYLAIVFLFFTSCEKDEIPVEPHTAGDVTAKKVEMGSLYADQIWYDIEQGTEVSRNPKTIWDLAFENTENGWHILLNSANRMQAALTNDTNLETISDTLGLQFSWDSHTGNLDSTGIGDWKTTSNLYVLDRGKDEIGKSLGLAKVLFDSVSSTHFYFRYADFDGKVWKNASIKKDSSYVYSYFSFTEESQILVSPPKQDWDICFTQYTYIYYYMNPVVAYLVTGVTLNPTNALSAQVFDKPFKNITLDDMNNYEVKSRIDNIGFDWKTYDFDAGYYITHPDKNYIFRVKSGKMYKIHFLDWYNDQGEKGTASFEFSEL